MNYNKEFSYYKSIFNYKNAISKFGIVGKLGNARSKGANENTDIIIKMKNKTKGNNTKNHEIKGAPDLHITFNNHVQNKTYNIFIIKIKDVLETSQL